MPLRGFKTDDSQSAAVRSAAAETSLQVIFGARVSGLLSGPRGKNAEHRQRDQAGLQGCHAATEEVDAEEPQRREY